MTTNNVCLLKLGICCVKILLFFLIFQNIVAALVIVFMKKIKENNLWENLCGLCRQFSDNDRVMYRKCDEIIKKNLN